MRRSLQPDTESTIMSPAPSVLPAPADPPPATLSSIAVVVVNYGTADLAMDAVESVLARAHGGRDVEVHLVDNASPGDDAETIRQAHAARGWTGRVTLHLEAVNHGFGRGNNVVLRTLLDRDAPPDAVFLLNPDARLENEAIDLLARDSRGASATRASPGRASPAGWSKGHRGLPLPVAWQRVLAVPGFGPSRARSATGRSRCRPIIPRGRSTGSRGQPS